MDKQTLESTLIAESHRPDQAPNLDSFIRRAEDRIARSVRAVEMLRPLALTEAERLAAESPIYRTPADFLEDREISIPLPAEEFSSFTKRTLEKVALSDLSTVSLNNPVRWYALRGDSIGNLIEFRGVPAEDSEIEGEYFAKIARLVNPTDTNILLDNHESVYLDACLAELYINTQDLELAQVHLDKFADTVKTLNELAGRYFGGTRLFGRKRVIGDSAGSGY